MDQSELVRVRALFEGSESKWRIPFEAELVEIELLSHRKRPVTFNCNHKREMFRSATAGLTPEEKGEPLGGQSELLDWIRDRFLKWDARGGRFEVDDAGATSCKDGARVWAFLGVIDP